MINFSGEIIDRSNLSFTEENRAFKYGDAVFETIKFANGKLVFWEDHYFRLMTGMRIFRMDIPMNFSPEYLEEQILETITANHLEHGANRVRLSVFRADGGTYTPKTNNVEYIISVSQIPHQKFELNETGLVLDLYKDHFKQKSLLSNIKSANALLYVLASVFKKENGLNECVLLNDDKHVVEAISSNIFMVKGNEIITPPESSGCLKGVMRKNVLKLLKSSSYDVKEETFSPFELQRADEVFLTNAIKGIQWVGKYRKKEFTKKVSLELVNQLNELI